MVSASGCLTCKFLVLQNSVWKGENRELYLFRTPYLLSQVLTVTSKQVHVCACMTETLAVELRMHAFIDSPAICHNLIPCP